MKILKTRKVKTPENAGGGINFFIPYDHPGTDYLAPNQSRNIPLGLSVKIGCDGFALLPISTIRDTKAQNPTAVTLYNLDGDQNKELYAHVTNTGDDLLELKPGKLIAHCILVPTLFSEIEEVKTFEAPKKDPELDFKDGPVCPRCKGANIAHIESGNVCGACGYEWYGKEAN